MNASSQADPPELSPAVLRQMNAQLRQQLEQAELKIRVLEERLRLERIARYGKRSETLNDLQLELLDLEPGVSSEEVAAESEREHLGAGGAELRLRGGRHERLYLTRKESEPTWGLEPQTCALRKRCSTTELSGRLRNGAGTYATRTVSQAATIPFPAAPLTLPLAASAMRVAASRLMPMIECCGFTPRFVGNTLESTT